MPRISSADVGKLPKEREVTPSEMSTFLKSLVDVRVAVRPLPLSQLHLLTRFVLRAETRFTTRSSRKPILARSHIAIAMALRDSTILDFDQLFELNAVIIAQMHLLFVLWTFLSGTPDALRAWKKADTSRSLHDRDLNRAAGSLTENDPPLCRAHIRNAAVSSVGHALREDLGEYRIWISTSFAFTRRCSDAVTMAVGPAPKLSGGMVDAHFRRHMGLSVSMLTPAALSIDYTSCTCILVLTH
ncbi:hypothetical protein EDB83DRAFT_2574365 [Lactarius deliciosus]|nr:hypothetical protein EDB83DRAFT_2574365 [Lactarius deliciosus]